MAQYRATVRRLAIATLASAPVISMLLLTRSRNSRSSFAGVVPLSAAHLDGANVKLTLDCFHSINEAGTTRPTDNWYGAEPVIDSWLGAVADELRNQRARKFLPI